MPTLHAPRVQIQPLGSMVLVKLQDAPQHSRLHTVQEAAVVRRARILAIGPEVQDLAPQQLVLVNTLAGMAIQDQLLVPEIAILATL